MRKHQKPADSQNASAFHNVGYGKPPVESRFQPGRSGNPKGRPKGAQNRRPALNEERLKNIILDEAYRTIKVAEAGRQVSIPMAQAVVRAIAVNAARGQLRAQQLFAELLGETERANKALHDQYLQAAIEYKQDWEDALERRKRCGLVGPEPLPHPDHVVIDLKRGEVLIKGPMTREEKVEWDRLWDRVEECDREITELTASLKERKNRRYREIIESDIAHEKKIRAMLVNAVGEPKERRR